VTRIFEIGPFRLDPDAGVLTRDGKPAALGPRAVAVLKTLVEHANEFVPKALILDAAWPGLVVEENNLSVQITGIRRVLAQAGGERWIETLSRRGYRFVGPVKERREGRTPESRSVSPRSNLPAQLTSFIGRERELVEIKRLLPSKRLLTLVGIGGIGKTRLAMQVAAEVMDAYRDGVWLVEFALINETSLVPTSVAKVLGVQEKPGTPLTDTLCEDLKSRQLLLILDNCEHLLDACARLADAVLRGVPQATIIVTSRELLHVAGEQTYLLPTLSLPDPTASADVIGSSEAVALFVERAQRQRLDFELNAARAPTIAQLCIHLDGIPLALELAAARIGSLSVEQINARIDDRFRLLTAGARTALPRQQTLRATLDWSYDLLREAEKTLFGRVAVFSGGWTLEAAKQVCIRADVDEFEALELLTSLADKNLIVAEEQHSATRYRMLETVREYARERLLESGEEAQWQSRHLAHFAAVAEEAAPHLRGADQQAWLDRLDAEHDNLRSALAWSSGAGGNAAGGLALAGALWRFWYTRGYAGESRGWLSKLLSVGPGGQAAAARAKALHGASALAWQQGDYPAARTLGEESLALVRELGDLSGIAASLDNLATLAYGEGDYASCRALYEESLAIFREVHDRWGTAATLDNLGTAVSVQGDYAFARALHEESLAIRRELGDRRGIAFSLGNLGTLACNERRYPAARVLLEEALTIFQELGDRRCIALCLNNLGTVARDQGDYPVARALCEESLALRRELGDRRGVAESLEELGYCAFALVGSGRSARIWGAAERLREEIASPIVPPDRPQYDRQVAAARAATGDDAAFDLAWQEGRAMTLDQAVEYALKWRVA
jgi:predicted ATPase/DNA-binding winged helix-turn-helix (wHTH) protein